MRAEPWREKCQKLREYPISRTDGETGQTRAAEKEEEEEEEETSPTRRENRGAARPIPPSSRERKRGDETNRENETKPCRETQ